MRPYSGCRALSVVCLTHFRSRAAFLEVSVLALLLPMVTETASLCLGSLPCCCLGVAVEESLD